jgi:uncharacterized protein
MSRLLAIAIHDVSPRTLAESQSLAQMVEAVAGRDIALTLLVVPHHHRATRIDQCRSFRRWIDKRLAQGDELALHGMWHVDEGPAPRRPLELWKRRVLTDGEAEFGALPADSARLRIEQGLELFALCGWKANGFVPPAWQLSAPARGLVREFSFRYFTTRGFILAPDEASARPVPALSLSGRSSTRRIMSRHWARYWQHHHQRADAVRFALHPVDALFAATRAIWTRCLERAVPHATLVTKSQLLK